VKKRLFFMTMSLLLYVSVLFAEPSVSASVDQPLITMQNRITFSLEFEDFSSFPGFSYDFKPDFMIISGPNRSTQFSMVNGRSSSKKILSYTLAPLREGELTIPAFSFSYRGKTYQTKAIKVTVQQQIRNPNTRQKRPEPAFIEVIPAKTHIVSGEAVPVIFKLFYQVQVVNFSFDPISSIEGALLENIQQSRNPSVTQETIDGQTYSTAILRRIIITPTRSGDLTIPPQKVRLEVKSQRSSSFFDDPFFGGAFTTSMDLISPAYTINVKSLPPSPSEAFTGAVGDYSLMIKLDTNLVQANQAVSYSVTVSGDGNLKTFTFPKMAFPKSMQVFEPRVKENIHIQDNGISGSKTWEYVLIPDEPGLYEMPPARFSYYSPKQKRYIHLEKSLPPIQVTPNERLIAENQGALTPQQVQFLREDIRHIYRQEGKTIQPNRPLLQNGALKIAFAGIAGFLLLFAITNLLWYRRVNDPVYQRRFMAFPKARQALKSLEEKDLVALSAVLNQYLADIFNLFVGEVRLTALQQKFPKGKRAQELLDELTSLLEHLEALKYAPQQDIPTNLKERISLMIQKLEEIRQ
jgi:hypothetical protein